MCGIASIVSKNNNEETISSMLDIMKHRGRDCTSILTAKHNDRNVYLGHNRLSINDVASNITTTQTLTKTQLQLARFNSKKIYVLRLCQRFRCDIK